MTTPMSGERFADRFRFYRDQRQQQRGVLQLDAAISSIEPVAVEGPMAALQRWFAGYCQAGVQS